MANTEHRPTVELPRVQVTGMAGPSASVVPDNWFVDPIRLGVPGVRQPDAEDNPLAWQTDSLCAQTDPEAFFPEKGGSTRDAKKICGSCEVRSRCLEYALENDERFGIWGGLSERERRKLRKRA
jgi:WhiB family redox-sensing transcriptional regulator